MNLPLAALKNIGKVIIVLAFVVSLNFYLLIFTVPFFCLGVIAIWFSKENSWTKVLWTALPVLLWYPVGFLFMYLSGVIGNATAQKLDFIFPPNFEGKVIVIENMPCGQPVKVENGREQLFVPANGVLLYQGKLKDGYVNHRYYQLQPSGYTKELQDGASDVYADSDKEKTNTTTVTARLVSTGNGTIAEGIDYSFMDLLVAAKNNATSYYDFQYKSKFKALTDSLIKQCK